MPQTEQDLRDLLADRSAAVPTVPGRLAEVRRRVRRRHRLELVVAVLAVGLVGLIGMSIMRLGSAGAPSLQPASPIPTTTPLPSTAFDRPTPLPYPAGQRVQPWTRTVDGLRITTSGPVTVFGTGVYPFTVEVVLTNIASTTWEGTVGVGLYGQKADGYFKGQFLYPADTSYPYPCCEASGRWFTQNTSDGFWIQGIADPTRRVIRPGQAVTILIGINKPAFGYPQEAIRGWVPVLNPRDPDAPSPAADARYPRPTDYPTVGWD
jgi:hypothetical protein